MCTLYKSFYHLWLWRKSRQVCGPKYPPGDSGYTTNSPIRERFLSQQAAFRLQIQRLGRGRNTLQLPVSFPLNVLQNKESGMHVQQAKTPSSLFITAEALLS